MHNDANIDASIDASIDAHSHTHPRDDGRALLWTSPKFTRPSVRNVVALPTSRPTDLSRYRVCRHAFARVCRPPPDAVERARPVKCRARDIVTTSASLSTLSIALLSRTVRCRTAPARRSLSLCRRPPLPPSLSNLFFCKAALLTTELCVRSSSLL